MGAGIQCSIRYLECLCVAEDVVTCDDDVVDWFPFHKSVDVSDDL